MAKNIIKQIIITLLLCLAIILILAVLLYAYVPNNKIIPEKISYTAPEDVKQVLKETVTEDSQVILTYEIQSSDLNNAERTNDYNPGKVNPFSSYDTTTENTAGATTGTTSGNAGTTTNSNTGTSTNNTTNTTNNNDDSSTTDEGTYFTDKGTK